MATQEAMQTARQYLSLLREGSREYDSCVEIIRRECQQWKFSLADIDTNEDEIKGCCIKGAKSKVRRYLDLLREGSWEYDSCVEIIRRECQQWKFSLADIGTNDEEIKTLIQRSEMKAVK